jgi:formylglycine-generating enzyme required for sulfatase activity
VGVRLPAGAASRFSFGDDPQDLAAVGNVADATAQEEFPAWMWCIAARDGFAFTAPVGRFKPNAWGLFDMHGNVWEWCGDGYAASYFKHSPVDDPPGDDRASLGVYRGCGYYEHWGYARAALRYPRPPEFRSNVVGFRVALMASEGR